ncbi:phosphatidylethanolamine N-methyltransferase [Xylariaceae sp. FL0255]|nr:phosphatidylethanolamine N-methyltransferase [Xylariaceae sp. FL0255]
MAAPPSELFAGDDNVAELRRRLINHSSVDDGNAELSSSAGAQDNELPSEDKPTANHEAKKTYGRTRGGTAFVVPITHDRIPQMFDPRQPKNVGDVIVLSVLALHVLTLYILPASLKKPVLAIIYLFWRAAYNGGIGFLLRWQSNDFKLVAWAQKWKLFEPPSTGRNPRPWLYNILKRDSETEVEGEFDFETAPIEYNTWLVFRRFVDLILLGDFFSYCLFAIACAHTPVGEAIWMTIGRWSLGLAIVGFNLWVKLDALRVIKDYAWYWGDFFFLIDQELTFDGVFEMAPHPMYSIGYAGYYGISMMAGSYAVLFISIVAHTCQFAFLVLIENPHIEKTYNPPTPRKREETVENEDQRPGSSDSQDSHSSSAGFHQPTLTRAHRLLGWEHIDLFRNTDYSTCLLLLYLVTIAVIAPQNRLWQFLLALHALLWRMWCSIGLGSILHRQSKDKMWTRHFLKFGDTTNEAWRQWKGMYHISQTMCYTSFIMACWKMYSVPADWENGFVLLRHVIGASLIALQIWTAMSIYQSLGEFGWFCGDFFFDRGVKLNYTSIYRFLNNPERIIGTAGLWGAALITWSKLIFALALTSHLLTVWFIQFVEQPHMRKIYGQTLRDEAGLTKFIKKSLPPYVAEWQSSVDRVMDRISQYVEEFLDAARPKLAASVSNIVRDTTALFNVNPARLGIRQREVNLNGCDPTNYKITVHGESSSTSAHTERSSGKEGIAGRFPNALKTMFLDYGAPIRVSWTAPARHGKKDWIGLYMVADNHSREHTDVSSLGRWIPTTPGQYESTTADKGILASDNPLQSHEPDDIDLVQGEVMFSHDKLWWTQGVYEFRYHHNGSHKVMAISQPFEIHIAHFDETKLVYTGLESDKAIKQNAIEQALLPIVQNCLDRDPDIAPFKPTEQWGSHVERDSKYPKRIVYAIQHMFTVDLSIYVVAVDGNVSQLAKRICEMKDATASYSMTRSSKGTVTPTEQMPPSP